MGNSSLHTYPVRLNVVFKYLGQLCLVLTIFTLVPVITSIFFREPTSVLRYAIVCGVYLGLGLSLTPIKSPANIRANEGMVVVVTILLFSCLINSFAIMSKGLNFQDAFFEVVSALTATGLTTIASVANAPQSLLFERAWLQWYGGLGFITLLLTIVTHPALLSNLLGNTELEEYDLLASTRRHSKSMIKVYCIITLLSILGAWTLGLNLFNATLYSFSAISTGGFEPNDGGIGVLNWPIQLWITLICLLAATPLTIYAHYLSKNSNFLKDALQFKALLLVCIVISMGVIACMYFGTDMQVQKILHNIPLLVVQAQTTTGFTIIPTSELSAGSKLILIFSMLLGGSAGSPAGGFKILRLLILLKIFTAIIRQIDSSRNEVLPSKLAGFRLQNADIIHALLLILLFLIVVFFSWVAFVVLGYDPLNSLFAIASAIGTVGTNIEMVNATLPLLLKLVLCIDMLFGKLEIIAWLVFLFPQTWLARKHAKATA